MERSRTVRDGSGNFSISKERSIRHSRSDWLPLTGGSTERGSPRFNRRRVRTAMRQSFWMIRPIHPPNESRDLSESIPNPGFLWSFSASSNIASCSTSWREYPGRPTRFTAILAAVINSARYQGCSTTVRQTVCQSYVLSRSFWMAAKNWSRRFSQLSFLEIGDPTVFCL